MSQAAAISPVKAGEEPVRDFIPDVYAIKANGRPMPGRVVNTEGHLVTVKAPNGREYTFPAHAILPAAEAEAHIRQDKVAAVNGYSFRLVARGTHNRTGQPVSSFRVSHPSSRSRSYVVTVGAVRGCSCPAYSKSGTGCKHLEAVAAQGLVPIRVPDPMGPTAPAAAITVKPVVKIIAAENW